MIYVTIPVHDEERTIGVVLWKVRRVMEEFGRDFRILVLDDASTDATPEVLARYAPFLPMKVIRSDRRLGPSQALDRLFREAVEDTHYPKRDVVVTLQADFSDDPSDLVGLVKAVEGGADIVTGLPPAPTQSTLKERVVSWLRRRILGPILTQAPVTDPLYGLRAYRVVVLRKALREAGGEPLAVQPGEAGNLELLGKLAGHARRIEEVEVTPRPHLKVRPSRARSIHELRSLVRVRKGVEWSRELAS